jgi:hypothetical protein
MIQPQMSTVSPEDGMASPEDNVVPMVHCEEVTSQALAEALAMLPQEVRAADDLAFYFPREMEDRIGKVLRSCSQCGHVTRTPSYQDVPIEFLPGLLYPFVAPESNLALGARPPFLDPAAAVILSTTEK